MTHSGRAIASFRRRLCTWFAARKRDLPWRGTRDPYAIWVSEAMLQQTRVETVIPYYARFLARYPDVAALARAPEEDVLALWSGLGYYRRARSLRAAAREIVGEHAGRFPREREALLDLPGFGPYTAGAVLSIAFDLPEPLVDGNVARVLARHFAIEEPIDSKVARERSWELARELVPPTPSRTGSPVSPRNFNQGLMELGALVCTPRAPLCGECPLRSSCAARAAGRQEELPRRARGRPQLDVRLEVLIVRRRGRVLVVRRPARGRMERMWELPTRELPDGRGRVRGLWPAEHAVPLRAGEELGSLRHSITHHRISAAIRAGRLSNQVPADSDRLRWVQAGEFEGLAVTGLTRKLLAKDRSNGG